jgi:hypothetical protein
LFAIQATLKHVAERMVAIVPTALHDEVQATAARLVRDFADLLSYPVFDSSRYGSACSFGQWLNHIMSAREQQMKETLDRPEESSKDASFFFFFFFYAWLQVYVLSLRDLIRFLS